MVARCRADQHMNKWWGHATDPFKIFQTFKFNTILFPHYLTISDHIWSYLITILKLLKPQELWGSGVCLDLQRLATGLINGMAALVRAAVCESWFRAPSDQVQKSWNRKVGRRETIFDNSWILSFETYVSCNLFMSPWLPFLGSWMGCQGSGGKVGGDPNGNMGSTSGHWLLWKF